MQVEFRTELGDPPGDRVAAEGAGGDHGDAVRDLRDLFPDHRHKRMLFQGFGDLAGECRPVYRQRAAGGNPVVIRRAHHEGVHPTHLGLQQADRVGQLVAA